MAKAGQTHTNAYKTNIVEENGKKFYVGASDGFKRSLEAHMKKNTTRMFVDGKYIPKSHPLHKAGRYDSFEDAAFSSLTNYKTNPKGQVYAMYNPAWPDWIKVGKAVDAEDRLKNYQTSSPLRNYKLLMAVDVDNRNEKEAEAHVAFGSQFKQRNEWFKCSKREAKKILRNIA
jgi:hypothetical protein